MKIISVEELSKLMQNQKNIRNITVLAGQDHGEGTMKDLLVATKGFQIHDGIEEVKLDPKDYYSQYYGKSHTIALNKLGSMLYHELDNQNDESKHEEPYLINLSHVSRNLHSRKTRENMLKVTD